VANALLPSRALQARHRPHAVASDRACLLVAPMSGHFATLLRGTVETFLPESRGLHHRLAGCARDTLSDAASNLDDYIDTMASIFRFFGGDVHVFSCASPRAGARGNRHDGGGRRSRGALTLMLAAGRSIRASIRRSSTRWPSSAARTGSAATSSPTCPGRAPGAAGQV